MIFHFDKGLSSVCCLCVGVFVCGIISNGIANIFIDVHINISNGTFSVF